MTKALERIAGDLAQELHQVVGDPISDPRAERGVAPRRIAADAFLIQILALPSEPYSIPLGAKEPELLFQRLAQRNEIPCEIHGHQVGAEMQHQRRLKRAAMDAVPEFAG